MKYATLIVLVFHSFVHALDFRVASYNVENLFDLTNNGTEYEEYIPNTKYWHQKAYTNKLANIKRVLIDLDAEIVSLQEIESQEALNDLLKLLPKYKYSQFIKKKNSAIGLALISKYKINSYKTITVDNSNDRERDILKTNILIDNKEIIIYTNHWRSKRSKENYRILYAKALLDEIKLNTKDLDYIIIGDLNSNYNEFQTFKREKKLNNTYNITGINHVLNTTLHGNFINKQTIQIYNEIVHYNTWLDLELKNRFSSIYRKANTTPDNILLSKALFDTKNITYKDNSLEVFKPIYLFNNKKIKRWNKYSSKGYSDHLPISALFTTDILKEKSKVIKQYITDIDFLYKIQTLQKPLVIKNVSVIYKSDNIAIIKEKKKRAIMIYNAPLNLKLGFVYNLQVNRIEYFSGIKEITKMKILKEIEYRNDYKSLYTNGTSIDMLDEINQNEIITNISGTYDKKIFTYIMNKKEHKINIYFKKGVTKPKNGQKVTIRTAHLAMYKSMIQLIIYKNNDFY